MERTSLPTRSMSRALAVGFGWYVLAWLVFVCLLGSVLAAWNWQRSHTGRAIAASLARGQERRWQVLVRELTADAAPSFASRFRIDESGRIREARPSWLEGTDLSGSPIHRAGAALAPGRSGAVLAADPRDDLARPVVVVRTDEGIVAGSLPPETLLLPDPSFDLELWSADGTIRLAATGAGTPADDGSAHRLPLAGSDLVLRVVERDSLFRTTLLLAALASAAVALLLLFPLMRMRREKRRLQEERGYLNRLISRLVSASSDRSGILTEDLGKLQAAATGFLEQARERRLAYQEHEHQLQLTSNLIVSIGRLVERLQDHARLLETSHEHLHAIINALEEAVVTVDRDLRLQMVNQAAETLLDRRLEAIAGRPLNEVLPVSAKHGQRLAALCRRSVERDARAVLHEPVSCADPDGDEHRMVASSCPLRADREVTGAVLTLRDITEQYHLQTQLQHSQRVDTIGRLAAGIAHDFKNILTSILMSAERLQNEVTERPELRRRADTILSAADKASRLTTQLMNYVRQQEPEPKPNDIHALLDEAVSILQENCGEHVDIDTRCHADHGIVLCDQGQMINALVNLGVNARDAMPRGGQLVFSTRNLPGRVSEDGVGTGVYSETGLLEIEISDTGCGMSPETRDRIFEPFFTTKQQGTGLGLSTMRDLIRSYAGEIDVESVEGKGTVFRIKLPTSPRSRGQSSSQSSWRSIVNGEGSLLVADDEEAIRELLRETCEDYGFTVITAADGQEALDRFREHRADIDVVLLDMHMPKLDGVEAFRRIRGIDPAARVILCSGYTDKTIIERLFADEGLDGHLVKPYTTKLILQAIRDARDAERSRSSG